MKQEEIEKEEINKENACNNENADNNDNQTTNANAEAEAKDEANADTEGDSLEQDNDDPLEVANRQIEELKDKYLRTMAEFDNYRKRTLKEKAELILNGGEKAVTAILPIIDDMERAIANGQKSNDPQVLKEGMELIFQKFIKTLETMGVKRIETQDADFNTDEHEAIAMVPGMGDDKKGKVLDCVQTGYKMNDKVIRHAKVAVGQ